MGVKGLNDLIRACYKDVPRSEFFNRRIAVDFMLVWHGYWSGAVVDVISDTPTATLVDLGVDVERVLAGTLEGLFSFTNTLLAQGIQPVFVFDGHAHPQKQLYAGKRREKARQTYKDRIEQMNISMDSSAKDIEAWRSLLRYHVFMPREECTERAKALLRGCAVPYLTSKTEAEHLCAALCRDGYVAAVYTKDTDVFPLQTPLVISASEDFGTERMFKMASYQDVLAHLRMTPETFTDLCIFCETDYNTRFPGFGPKKAQSALYKHGTLERVIEEVLIPLAEKKGLGAPHEELHPHICRSIFTPLTSEELSADPLSRLHNPLSEPTDNPLWIYARELCGQIRPQRYLMPTQRVHFTVE